jgi:hypothetical protein
VILALAIKQLMAAKLFEPVESELREALAKVQQKLVGRHKMLSHWCAKVERADALVYAFDRPTWDAAYANLPSDVPLAMLAIVDDEQSARWRVLDQIWDKKYMAEEAAAREVAKLREAACDAKPPAKRTRKPRRA